MSSSPRTLKNPYLSARPPHSVSTGKRPSSAAVHRPPQPTRGGAQTVVQLPSTSASTTNVRSIESNFHSALQELLSQRSLANAPPHLSTSREERFSEAAQALVDDDLLIAEPSRYLHPSASTAAASEIPPVAAKSEILSPAKATTRPQSSKIYSSRTLRNVLDPPRVVAHETVGTTSRSASTVDAFKKSVGAALRAGIEHMTRDDYAAGLRCFVLVENRVEKYHKFVVHQRLVMANERVLIAKFYVNIGVCAACCGYFDLSSRHFEKALEVSTLAEDISKQYGLIASLADACKYNMRTSERLHEDQNKAALRLLNDSMEESNAEVALDFVQADSVSIAKQFYVFVKQGDVDSESSAVLQKGGESEGSLPCRSSSGIVQGPRPSRDHLSVEVLNSLLSHTRCLLQLNATAPQKTRLRIIVSRPRLVHELAMYLAQMAEDERSEVVGASCAVGTKCEDGAAPTGGGELFRPIEMSVKGETAIDGGHGGVTNDVLSQFFDEGGATLLPHKLPSRESSAIVEVPPRNVRAAAFAFGALLVKCFVEGRSFTMPEILRFRAVRKAFATPLFVADSDHWLFVDDDFNSWAEILHRHLACWVALDAQQPEQRDDMLRAAVFGEGVAFHRSIEYYRSPDKASELMSVVPSHVASAAHDFYQQQRSPQCNASLHDIVLESYLWNCVIGSRLSILRYIQSGLMFGGRLVGDLCLHKWLFSFTCGQYEQQQAWDYFFNVVSGLQSDPSSSCDDDSKGESGSNSSLTAKAIVSVLEFRGWSPAQSAPYYLCSWLHYRATDAHRRLFVQLCTGMSALPSRGSGDFDRIVVVPSASHMYAKTCFYTLYLPVWEQSSIDDAGDCLTTAMEAIQLDRTMQEDPSFT